MADSKTNRSGKSDEATKSTGCPDCDSGFEFLTLREFFSRREFIKTAATATGVAAVAPWDCRRSFMRRRRSVRLAKLRLPTARLPRERRRRW